MFIEIMKAIGIFYMLTWFIWPFAFILSLVSAIGAEVRKENSTQSVIAAAISLTIILAGVTSFMFS